MRAKSSSDQCETGTAASAGWVVARTTTWWRSSGGKSPRTTTPREVAQPLEALADKAVPPAGDGVRVAAEFVGDAEVGGLVGLGAAQDEAGPKGEALR